MARGVELPDARPGDAEDVVWGLSTAGALWARGDEKDAILWIRRAATSALEAGHEPRAAELSGQADALEDHGEDVDSERVTEPVALAPASERVTAEPQASVREPESLAAARAGVLPRAPSRPPVKAPSMAPAPSSIEPPRREPVAPPRRREPPPRRSPILDPWGDEISGTDLDSLTLEQRRARSSDPGGAELSSTLVVHVRPSIVDDEVVSSAAPLSPAMLKSIRARRTPPPPPTARAARRGVAPAPLSPPAPSIAVEAARERPAPPSPSAGRLGPVIAEVPSKRAATPVAAPAAIARLVDDVPLDDIEAFADLPDDLQAALASAARIEELGPDEEVKGFGAALILRGDGVICAAIVDVPVKRVAERMLVSTRGTLRDGIALRLVAGDAGARVATWDQALIDDVLRDCPWVLEELRRAADHAQALAGATMGPLGDLDDVWRDLALGRMALRVAAPHEIVIGKGQLDFGLTIIGAGALELVDELGSRSGDTQTGDLLFAGELLRHAPAPHAARATEAGALVLVADRHEAHELLLSVPPLLELVTA